MAGSDETTPAHYANMSDEDAMEPKDFAQLKLQQDRLTRQLQKQNHGDYVQNVSKFSLIEDYPVETFTWRDLFFKLCFEQMMSYFPQH